MLSVFYIILQVLWPFKKLKLLPSDFTNYFSVTNGIFVRNSPFSSLFNKHPRVPAGYKRMDLRLISADQDTSLVNYLSLKFVRKHFEILTYKFCV